MFINFWYPAIRSDELAAGKPLYRKMLGQDFVLFRDSKGAAHCLSNVCTHRGGFLANGKVKGDCIECPYHGWQFNGAGECERIPSMGKDAKIPSRSRIDSYPVDERYGLVFAFLGDLPEAERPPIMNIPEYGQEGWRATIQYFEWDIDYKRSIENNIDPSHNEFVHDTHGFGGINEDYRVGDLDFRETTWGSGFYNKMFAPPLADEKMRNVSERQQNAFIEVGTGHYAANCIWTYIHPTDKIKIHQYAFELPIDEDKTAIYLVNLRNFLTEPDGDERMIRRNEYVAFQDRDILNMVRPVVTPRTNTKEVFVPADRPIARYRQFLGEWEARGWRVDVEKVKATQSRVAYAIPSPERRRRKGWPIDAVPLVPAKALGEEMKAAE